MMGSSKGKATGYTDFYKNTGYGTGASDGNIQKRGEEDDNETDPRKRALKRRMKRMKVG